MDSNHVHSDACKPKTACQEGMLRLMDAVQLAEVELNRTPFYRWQRKTYLKGSIFAMVLCIKLLESLDDKYNNESGSFN